MKQQTRSVNYLLPILVLVLFVAMWQQLAHWRQLSGVVEQAELELNQLQQGSVRYLTLNGPKRQHWQVFTSPSNLANWLKTQHVGGVAGVAGLPVAKVYPESVRLQISNVNYAALVQWLYRLQSTSNAKVSKLSLSSTGEPGKVFGELVLTLQQRAK